MYVRNILVCCVGTWSHIFDVIIVLDTSTCIFCVVRKTIRPDIILKNTTYIKKLKYAPIILTKSYYILSVFELWTIFFSLFSSIFWMYTVRIYNLASIWYDFIIPDWFWTFSTCFDTIKNTFLLNYYFEVDNIYLNIQWCT